MTCTLLTLLVLSGHVFSGVASGRYKYDQLYNHFQNVDFGFTKTVPREHDDSPAEVQLSLVIQRVVELVCVLFQNEDRQELVALGVLTLTWNDDRLQWNPWLSDGVQSIVWPDARSFWTPDVVVWNGFGSEFDSSPETLSLRLTTAGNVTWSRPLRLRVPCDTTAQGNDIRCVISFTSWAHDQGSLRLKTADDSSGADLLGYWPEAQFDVTNVGVTLTSRTSVCCSDPFDVINFEIIVSY